jgi:hypothetical protein
MVLVAETSSVVRRYDFPHADVYVTWNLGDHFNDAYKHKVGWLRSLF